jgi:hypothetical protein
MMARLELEQMHQQMSFMLHVNGSGDTTVRVTTSSTSLEPKLVFVDGSGDYASLEKVNRDIKIKAFNTDVAYFTNGGNVGIGETSPQNPLHVRSDSASGENYAIQIDNNNTTVGSQIGMLFRSRVGTTNTDFSIRGIANGSDDMDLTFNSDGGSERLRITKDGDIGIGTSSPSANLHVSSTGDTILRVTSADGNGAFLDLGDASDTDGGRIVYDSGSNLAFYTASTEPTFIYNRKWS